MKVMSTNSNVLKLSEKNFFFDMRSKIEPPPDDFRLLTKFGLFLAFIGGYAHMDMDKNQKIFFRFVLLTCVYVISRRFLERPISGREKSKSFVDPITLPFQKRALISKLCFFVKTFS